MLLTLRNFRLLEFPLLKTKPESNMKSTSKMFTEQSLEMTQSRRQLNKHREYIEKAEELKAVLKEEFDHAYINLYVSTSYAEVSLTVTIIISDEIRDVLKFCARYNFHQRKDNEPRVSDTTGRRSYELFIGTKPVLFHKDYCGEQEEFNFMDLFIEFRDAEGDACRSVETGKFETPRPIMKFLCGAELEAHNKANG